MYFSSVHIFTALTPHQRFETFGWVQIQERACQAEVGGGNDELSVDRRDPGRGWSESGFNWGRCFALPTLTSLLRILNSDSSLL